MAENKCLICGELFTRPVWRKAKTCSYKCSNKLPKSRMLGKKHTVETKEKISLTHKGIIPLNILRGELRGERHPLWKGVDVSYRALHKWVELHLGKPVHCEFCGLNEIPKGKKRYFQWANKSGKYLRDLSDWLRLCLKCHKAYDGYGIGEYENF